MASENLAGNLGAREYAFRFENNSWARFKTFSSVDEFKKAVVQSNPAAIHFGAVYVRIILLSYKTLVDKRAEAEFGTARGGCA